MRPSSALVLPICVLALALLTGCSDDDPPTGPAPEFSLALTVTHLDGSPAAGVRVAGMPVLANWMAPAEPPVEGGAAPWRRIRVGFDMLANGFAKVTVIDVAGDEVRTLLSAPIPSGVHLVEWDGLDDDGQPLPGGWYDVHIVLTWSDTAGRSSDVPVLLEVCDPDWHSLGTTGPDGRLVIDDRRLVPAFFDCEQVGGMEFTTETLLRLENQYGDGQYVSFDAADAEIDLDAVWNPEFETFRFEMLVVDQAGDPLEGVAVGSLPALPESVWPWPPNNEPTRSRVAIPFELTEPLPVRIHIQDVTGAVIRDLPLGHLAAGEHRAIWDGRDESGITTRSGWYEVVILFSEYGGDPYWTAVDSAGVVHVPFDTGHVSLGETDADGRLVITDRRLVPALWDLPAVTFRDENGDDIGTYELTTTTWLNCRSDVSGGAWAVVEAVDGAQAVPVSLLPPDGHRAPSGGTMVVDKGDGPDNPPPPISLGGPFPNPFN